MYSFVPFHGTPLRKICEDMGLINPEDITLALTDKPSIQMEQYPEDQIEGLKKRNEELQNKFGNSRGSVFQGLVLQTVERLNKIPDIFKLFAGGFAVVGIIIWYRGRKNIVKN